MKSELSIMQRELVLGGYTINDDNPSFVIAEIGHNHQGSLDIAKQMVHSAKDCGVNAVKLQKRFNKDLFVPKLYDSPYVSDNAYGYTYGEHREALEFGEFEFRELISLCNELDILFFATAFDFQSVDFLNKLDTPFYKSASGDLTNIPLLKYIAQTQKPLLVSTGAANLDDVKRAHDAIMPINSNLAFLQCTAKYPTPPEDMNLRVIETYRNEFPEAVVGLSDHQNGIAMALIAFMLGARIFEKHFTLDRAARGTDHSFSLEPPGLKRLVRDLNRAKAALGNGEKEPLDDEKGPMFKMSKKIVAARDLQKGCVLKESDFSFKSPGDGLPPYRVYDIIGKTLLHDIKTNEDMTMEHIE
jgi:sialic acid synthase